MSGASFILVVVNMTGFERLVWLELEKLGGRVYRAPVWQWYDFGCECFTLGNRFLFTVVQGYKLRPYFAPESSTDNHLVIRILVNNSTTMEERLLLDDPEYHRR